jgi:hypothetical protein
MAERAATSFILEAHGPQRVVEHVVALEPSSAGKRSPDLWDM